MSIDKLVQKLEQQPKTVDQYWVEKRHEWIEDVAVLMKNIADWLQPAVDKKLARIERRAVVLDEQDTGSYEVEALTVHLGEREVRVEP